MVDGYEYRFSIVMPTYNRRDILLKSLDRLREIERPWPCELVVVVDGSTDGSAVAARSVSMPYPTRVITQPNRGAAAARNHGARIACGEFLLFLDDDMAADPRLLVEHDRVLTEGADAAVGHLPLHPESPPSLLTHSVDRWARRRHARLTRSRGQLTLSDLLTGQLSVRTGAFGAVGGFDEEFNVDGQFGAEDTDFLHRLLEAGASVRYAPGAVSYQRYVVTPEQHLRQWRQAGLADTVLLRKHPSLTERVMEQRPGRGVVGRALPRVAPRLPNRVLEALGRPVLARARAGRTDLPTQWAFARLRDAQYWRGVHEGGGFPARRTAVVLAYHTVEDVPEGYVQKYSVPPEEFSRQIEALDRAGFRWIGVQDLLAHLDGRSLPDRAILLTFDDGYASLAEHAAPVLRAHGIPALVCLVSSLIGRFNEWDADADTKLPLLSADELRSLVADGWSLAAHSRSHAHLTRLDRDTLQAELAGCLRELRELGLPVEPVLAYPYGEHDARVRAQARGAGYLAALALEGPRATVHPRDRYAIPRVEVTRDMAPEEVVRRASHPPRWWTPQVRRELSGMARWLIGPSGGER